MSRLVFLKSLTGLEPVYEGRLLTIRSTTLTVLTESDYSQPGPQRPSPQDRIRHPWIWATVFSTRPQVDVDGVVISVVDTEYDSPYLRSFFVILE